MIAQRPNECTNATLVEKCYQKNVRPKSVTRKNTWDSTLLKYYVDRIVLAIFSKRFD